MKLILSMTKNTQSVSNSIYKDNKNKHPLFIILKTFVVIQKNKMHAKM